MLPDCNNPILHSNIFHPKQIEVPKNNNKNSTSYSDDKSTTFAYNNDKIDCTTCVDLFHNIM